MSISLENIIAWPNIILLQKTDLTIDLFIMPNYFTKLIFVISLSGPITSSGCASPDLAEGLFQTRQPTQFCEWRNGVIGRDAVCYCGTNECNAKEMLENWIKNGGGCKLPYFRE